MPKQSKGSKLCSEWGLVAKQCLYSEWGNYYGLIKLYPAALLDSNGYLYLESSNALNIPGIKIGKRINVPKRISSLPGYVKMKQENIIASQDVNYLNMDDIEYKDESLITKSQWKDILQNNRIAHELDIKTVLVVFNSSLHRSTATEIAEILGEKDYHIISGGNISFSRRICETFNIKPPKNSDGGNRWWTIPYWGSPTGDGKYFYILRPELKEAIEELISEGKICNRAQEMSTIAEEISEKEAIHLFEGAKKQITVNAYERNPEARRECIKEYGYKCSVCGFDFAESYGDIGIGFIEVHHLKPLNEINKKYEVNPLTDLRPICPNCHSMLHRSHLSIEKLRDILKKR
ncbi:Hnh endonuclease [Desulfosporosinus sp. I2]|uniref:HNH endonuclease n=1 Tax=Desulfosporosinus sp. I2 TaxID=1617025 RepID=UPI00061EB4D4|nr:HNH endonuclease [Desulfosporosinus sp. I2]KJR45060.1 Hnh endonuclease [Desulfosporosinus sp. I2]